jgi:hypothetical protein
MARVLAGCGCRCHQNENGETVITREEWQKNRKRMTRPERPSLSSRNEIRDPRIRALLQEGGE